MYRMLKVVNSLTIWESAPEGLKAEAEALLDRATKILKAQWHEYDTTLDEMYTEAIANFAGKLLQAGIAEELIPDLKEEIEVIASKIMDLTAEYLSMNDTLRIIGGSSGKG